MLKFDMRALQDALDDERRARGLIGISSYAQDLRAFPAVGKFADLWRTRSGFRVRLTRQCERGGRGDVIRRVEKGRGRVNA
jgi:hypothetical protein